MTKLLSCLFMIAIITSVCLPITSKADELTSGTGNKLITACNDDNYNAHNSSWENCVGFAGGVYVGVIFGSLVTIDVVKKGISVKDSENYFQIIFPVCIPDGATFEQLALVVSKYLHDHPERLNEPSSGLVIQAAEQAWPCPKPTK